MSKGQIITFLLILTIAFPAIIDPVPANLGNASNSSPTSTSPATQPGPKRPLPAETPTTTT